MFSIRNLDERNLVGGAKSDNKLLVCFLFAGLVEDAQVRLTAVKSLRDFTESAGKTVVHQGDTQNTLESVQDGQLTLRSGGGDFDLNVVNLLFYVRLFAYQLAL